MEEIFEDEPGADSGNGEEASEGAPEGGEASEEGGQEPADPAEEDSEESAAREDGADEGDGSDEDAESGDKLDQILDRIEGIEDSLRSGEASESEADGAREASSGSGDSTDPSEWSGSVDGEEGIVVGTEPSSDARDEMAETAGGQETGSAVWTGQDGWYESFCYGLAVTDFSIGILLGLLLMRMMFSRMFADD